MDCGTGSRSGRPWRAASRAALRPAGRAPASRALTGLVRPAVAGMALLLVAACGGGGSPGGSAATGGSSDYAKAVAYAQCMRSHGVPDFPDPNSQGDFIIQGRQAGASAIRSSAADRACRHLLPNGGRLTPAQQQRALGQLLRFSACMRAHGLPDFPDPTTSQGGVGLSLHGRGIDPRSPQFRAAQQACQNLMPRPPGSGAVQKGG